MKINIESDFHFSVKSISYSADGELNVTLSSEAVQSDKIYRYQADLGNGESVEKPSVSLVKYTLEYMASSNIKSKTKDSYRLMAIHLKNYGDCTINKVTTEYLQGFIEYLKATGLASNTVRLYFQKLTCVLHNAYKQGLFDDRILQRVRRVKKLQDKKGFLTESELRRMVKNRLPGKYDNIQSMFLFSCMTGLRFGDVCSLRWKDVKRIGGHLQLEFHQQKTDTDEKLPLCEGAEMLLRNMRRNNGHVFQTETNQRVNQVLQMWSKKAGIKKHVSFHMARHTFCVLLLTKDVPIFTVQQLMCHYDINTTKVYADLMNKTKTKAVKKIPVISVHREAV